MKTAPKNGNGNVRPDEAVHGSDNGEIREGDFVRITPAALKMARLSMMTPRLLYQIGHPGIFQVVHAFETKEDGICFTLGECCRYYVDRRTGQYRCSGHPSIYFEKIAEERKHNKGDRSTSVSVPWVGEVASVDFVDDEANPKLTVKIAGKPTVFTGMLAKIFGKAAQDNKIL